MPFVRDDQDRLAALLPEALVGTVERIEPITIGQSGAGVYAVTASRGAFILRLQPSADAAMFANRLLILRRAAESGVTPSVVHVDEAARAVVTVRVNGMQLPAALGDPAQRDRALVSLVDGLRTAHALDPSGIAESTPLAYARAAWQQQHVRPAFPPWAQTLPATFDAIADVLAGDSRRVVNHNDVNPMNVMWDGTKAWLVDWDAAGLGHRHYDLATLAMFLRLDDAAAFGLCARHDGAPLDEPARAVFRALRQMAALLCGLVFLGLSDDLSSRPSPTSQDAPSLAECYAAMRTGQLDLGGARGRTTFGLALLAEGLRQAAFAASAGSPA